MDEFDLDEDEVNQVNDVYRTDPRSNDRRICNCGHAMSRHHPDIKKGVYCKPGQLVCECINPRAVMEVPNTRYFMRKSVGSGTKHALARGYAAAKEAMGEDFVERMTWLIDKVCDKCEAETDKYYPVRTDLNGYALYDADRDMGVTGFLCPDCRVKMSTQGKTKPNPLG